jgi:hypothetical protein
MKNLCLMERPSELETFLHQRSVEGERADEGAFTISREQALQKLANFQLPFPYAWLLKLVQSVVAGGADCSLNFVLSSSELRLAFELPGLSIEKVEAAFFNPENSGTEALDHLMSALWVVGLSEGWAFQLRLEAWTSSLVWDGEALLKVDCQASHQASLTVRFVKTSGVVDWVKKTLESGYRNAEMLTTLKSRCYTCPLPLSVDGRRLDTLYNCPSHGPTNRDHTIALGFANASGLEELRIPTGTFDCIPAPEGKSSFWSLQNTDPAALRKLGERVYFKLSRQQSCPAPYLLTAHRRFHRDKQSQGWTDRYEQSILYWVRDGVVVDQDVLEKDGNPVSIAVFLSARGLDSDLGSFVLRGGPEKSRREKVARRAVRRSLDRLPALENGLKQTIQRGALLSKLAAGGLVLLGAATTWAAPALGLGFVGSGAFLASQAGKAQERQSKSLRESIVGLQNILAKA